MKIRAMTERAKADKAQWIAIKSTANAASLPVAMYQVPGEHKLDGYAAR
ncbi:hypothetical protein [Paenibacillus sabuli]|nr:hypothetical protein [Paenibacillus sabuli]